MKYLKRFIFVSSVVLISLSFQGCGPGSINWDTPNSIDPVNPIIDPIEEIVGQAKAIIYHIPQEYCSYFPLTDMIKSNLPEAGNFGLVTYVSTEPTLYTYHPDCGTETVSDTGGCMTYNLADEDPVYSENLVTCVIDFDLTDLNLQWPDEVILAVNDLTVNTQ